MRKIYRVLRLSVYALRRNLLRSALTTLGIVIGVAAVIAMMEIGKGSSTAVQQMMLRYWNALPVLCDLKHYCKADCSAARA